MKKILLSGLVIVTFVSYALLERFGGNNEVNVVAPAPTFQSSPNQPASNFPSQGPTPPGMMNSNPGTNNMMNGAYKDGQYTGSVADAFYGNVQVKAIISGGKITDVQFLQYPSDRSTSRMINSQAMPMLTQEAIQAQSAAVDGVSGATATSGAFVQSLQSALSQAK